MKKLVVNYLPKVLAFAIIFVLYALTVLPKLDKNEIASLKNDFRFRARKLFEPTKIPSKNIRQVHPQYKKISAWISSVGAAVTITDIDNNTLCNDIIHVDPRYDKVLISPAQGTLADYKPFELYPKRLPYDKATTAPMGTLAFDFNKDGKMDVLVYYWGRTPIIFYKTDNGFDERELCPVSEKWYSNAATLGDFDGDGNIDILIANYFPDNSKILDSQASDKNEVMQHSMSRAYNGGKKHFFLYQANMNFACNYKEEIPTYDNNENIDSWTLAVAAVDINDDLLPEIYFANDFGPDKLLYNVSKPGHLIFRELKGKRNFKDIRSGVLGKDSFKGMGVDFGDINEDGLLDIFVSNIADEYALEESHLAFINTGEIDKMNDGIAPFVNRSEELGISRSSWAWDAKIADFNNDTKPEIIQATGFIKGKDNGWAELQELAMANDELLSDPKNWPKFESGINISGNAHTAFFTKDNSGSYFDIAEQVGVAQAQVSRGIAISDIDHDGDLDYVVANQWQPSTIYYNQYTGNNKFIGLRVLQSTNSDLKVVQLDPESNEGLFAIGATVKVFLQDGKVLTRYVDGGNGHSGKNSTEIFLGIGNVNINQSIKMLIRWRSIGGKMNEKKISIKPGWHTLLLPQ